MIPNNEDDINPPPGVLDSSSPSTAGSNSNSTDTTTQATSPDTSGGSGGTPADTTNGTSDINGSSTETNSDGTTTTTNPDGTTTTNNPDGTTTTSATDPDGTEHYTTTGQGAPVDSTDVTVTHNDDGTNNVDSSEAQSGGTTVAVTDNGNGTTTTDTSTPGGTQINPDPPKDDDRTTDAHNQLDPNGQSVEPTPPADDSNPPQDTSGDDKATPPADPDPPQGEPESSGDSAKMSGDGGMGGDPGMDSEHATLPPGFGDLMKDALKDLHSPSHGGDTVNVTDSPDTGASAADATAPPAGSHLVHDTPADPAGPQGDIGEGSHPGGSPGSVGPNNGNVINDLDQGTQSNGPEERNTSHDMKYDIPSSGGGGNIGLPGPQTLPDNVSNQSDSHSISTVGKQVETTAQHLAQELKDTVAQHDDGPHGALNGAADKIAATVHVAIPLVHGVNLDDGNHFADFIKAAQNPAQSGLSATLQPAGADGLHHDAIGGGIGHDPGAHGTDDLHATIAVHAAPVAALHENAAEHYSVPVSAESLWHH